jgi:XisH protein
MPAKDIYHNAVKNALIQEGWIITNDPLHLKWGQKDMYVDLGAKQLLAAEQGTRKIAVEIKSFVSPSEMADLRGCLKSII